MRHAGGILSIGFSWLLLVAGCGERPTVAEIVKTVDAQGVLTYQGKTLENYQIIFHPPGNLRPAAGRTDAAGRFKLGTNKTGDGAVPGTHRVTVTYVGPEVNVAPGDEFKELPPPKVPEKYASPESSDITQEIPPGGTTDLKIDLK
jgi:hypothetical protein